MNVPTTRSVRALTVMLVAACASTKTATRTEAAPDVRLEGTISILATADKKGCRERDCVQEDVVRNLLFVGVPGTRIDKPMVPNEQQAMRDHKAFFADLLDKKGYGRFVVRVSEGRSAADDKAWNVVINTEALRKALEDAGVVRRFGY